jgi:hypothetical protein
MWCLVACKCNAVTAIHYVIQQAMSGCYTLNYSGAAHLQSWSRLLERDQRLVMHVALSIVRSQPTFWKTADEGPLDLPHIIARKLADFCA